MLDTYLDNVTKIVAAICFTLILVIFAYAIGSGFYMAMTCKKVLLGSHGQESACLERR